MTKILNEIDTIRLLIAEVTKEEEPKMKRDIHIDAGASFRQITVEGFKKETGRIRNFFAKHAERESSSLNVSRKYAFSNRVIFVKLLESLLKGEYEIMEKRERSLLVGKEWYSHKRRTNFYHYVSFRQDERTGAYIISDIADRRIMKDHSKKKKFGDKNHPIRKVGA